MTWTAPLTSLSFRPVRPEDKERVLAFTFNTWGDAEGDYIKDVFDEWLADPRGEFTAAVLNGVIVGIAKLTDQGAGEWWFEGLRIDPAYRRLGIASEFNRYHIELAKRLGGRVIRYMTGGSNVGSQTIGARAGFQHILTCTAYLAKATHKYPLPAVLNLADVPALVHWIDSPLMRYQHGAYRDAWTVRALTETELHRVVEAQLAYGIRDASGRLMAWAVLRPAEYDDSEDGEQSRLRVDHFDGELTAVTQLARQMRALAASRRQAEVSAGICDYPPLVQVIVKAGYHINPDKFSLWVLELQLTSHEERVTK